MKATIDDALKGVQCLGIDTAPIIYFVEANPSYDSIVTNVFQRISHGTIVGIASVITLTEVLVHPLRQNNRALARTYSELLTNSRNFSLTSITPAIAETGAELRARYNLRTPDALQVAAAIVNGCQAFLCNDKTLQRVAEIPILLLDELDLSTS